MAPRFTWFLDTGWLHSCGMSSPSYMPFLRRARTLSLRPLVGLDELCFQILASTSTTLRCLEVASLKGNYRPQPEPKGYANTR